ncbi:MAG: acyl-CoA desaturase [Cyanobacteria bacterium]|nr:acyl-CoA desaturase [Cyanobacteriota bacterium]
MNCEKSSGSNSILRWLDSDAVNEDPRLMLPGAPRTECDRWFPFMFLHAGCALVFITGCSSFAIVVCVALYCIRMFAITGFYHRYFSHRAFKTSRSLQLLFALIGSASMQRGPLWWAAHHRTHHARSDKDGDLHSPTERSFIWSHIGWLTSTKNMPTNYEKISDFATYPELRLLNRFDWFMPLSLIVALYLIGELLRTWCPALTTSGWQLVAWGFFVSTTILFHATCSINSVAHLFGYRRYETPDNSRNNPLLAILTLGEGWHNNHHKFSSCARQGFAWWEVDITYGVLVLFSKFGLVYDLKPLPASVFSSEKTVLIETEEKAGTA